MKIMLKTLNSLKVENNSATVSGQNGHIKINIYDHHIFSVFYAFDNYREDEQSVRASREMFSRSFQEKTTAYDAALPWETSRESESAFYLNQGLHSFKIEKANGVVTVFYKNIQVHGGIIGDENTVLPGYPLRIQQNNNTSCVKGKFNFHTEAGDAFFGLGEKSGLLNKKNRRFKMFNRDALGYNAEFSDPLYLSVPFFIKFNRNSNTLAGLFFPNPNLEEVDFGVESNYYYYVKLNQGPFGYFLFTGESYREILKGYATVTGKPALPPLYSFGFFGSSMSYTEPDDAEERVLNYFDHVEEHRIPCEGIYFSSGYLKSESGERHAFLWNRKKFKDPGHYIKKLTSRGYRVCCNLKPGILKKHPWYQRLAQLDFFIKGQNNEDYLEYYWGSDASFVDLFQDKPFHWWKEKIKQNYIALGIEGIWNDNNEYEFEDESLAAHNFRSTYPLLMAKAAYQAFRESRPGKRPWVISRAGTAGLQRYARTWSGDNVSDYHSLAFNTLMGLNLGLSGIPFYGHDIGGFFGPMPDKELFIRWCQSAVFQPRFVIHSWNKENRPTEPWTYPDALAVIRDLIREHYFFIPHIYNLAMLAAESGIPMQRPLCLEYPADPKIDLNDFNYLFGESLLVVSAVQEGCSQIEAYLPKNEHWYDPDEQRLYKGGQRVVVRYGLAGARYFIKAGSIIPVAPGLTSLKSGFFPALEFKLYPGKETEYSYREDDGESDLDSDIFNHYLLGITRSGEKYRLTFRVERLGREGGGRSFAFTLPGGFSFHLNTLTGDGSLVSDAVFSRDDSHLLFPGVPKNFSLLFSGDYPPQSG